MRSVLNEVQYPVKDQVRERVAGLNEPPVWDRIWSRVWWPVEGRVEVRVWSQVWDQANGSEGKRVEGV